MIYINGVLASVNDLLRLLQDIYNKDNKITELETLDGITIIKTI